MAAIAAAVLAVVPVSVQVARHRAERQTSDELTWFDDGGEDEVETHESTALFDLAELAAED
jgi:hypothetical protein